MPTPAQSDTAKAKAARSAARRRTRARLSVAREPTVRVIDAELRDRLIEGAYSADAGEGTEVTGMSDDEFLSLLRR